MIPSNSNEGKFENLRNISLDLISSASGEKILQSDKTFGEKIQFFENVMYKNGFFETLEESYPYHIDKNDEKSLELRNIGNDFYKKNDYTNALKLYNESICFATNKGEINLGVGFSNRSVIYYQLEMFQQCLENIELAKQTALPEKVLNKIEKRKIDCLKYLNDKNETSVDTSANFALKLCCGDNAMTQFSLAECLEVKDAGNMGRGVFTDRDLNAGDLIGVEEMFSWTVINEFKYSRCANCTKENYLSLIPCPDCTGVMFCSQNCLSEARNTFHQYECSIIDFMYQYLPSNFILTIRTLLNVLCKFKTVEDCAGCCFESINCNLYGQNDHGEFNLKKPNGPVYFLNKTYYDKSDPVAFHPFLPIIALLKYVLQRKTKLNAIITITQHHHFVSEAMLLYARIILDSSYCSKFDIADGFAEYQYLCPFESMFNHSCNPNVEHFIVGKKVYFALLQPIKRGMQLFTNYCPDFGTSSKQDRLNFLESRNFSCNCEACVKDFPIFDFEKAKSHKPKLYTKEFNTIFSKIEKISSMTVKEAYTYLKQCSNFMAKYYFKHFPDQPLMLVERLISKIVTKLLDDYPSTKKFIKK